VNQDLKVGSSREEVIAFFKNRSIPFFDSGSAIIGTITTGRGILVRSHIQIKFEMNSENTVSSFSVTEIHTGP
jgi:hypothetical protein